MDTDPVPRPDVPPTTTRTTRPWRRRACAALSATALAAAGFLAAGTVTAPAAQAGPPGSCAEGDRDTSKRIASLAAGTTVVDVSGSSVSAGVPKGVEVGLEFGTKIVYQDTGGPPTIAEVARKFFGSDDGVYTVKVRYSPEFECAWAWMGDHQGRQPASFWLDRSSRADPSTGWEDAQIGLLPYDARRKTNTYGGAFNVPQAGNWSVRTCSMLQGDPRVFCTPWLAPQ